MARRVFLHVGAPKSGTSYLQQVLWANRSRLREDGILLPGTRRAHHQAMCDLRGGRWKDPSATWTWDRLAAEVAAHDGTAVISEEMLGAAETAQAESAVRRLLPAEVHVVVAVRDLWRLIPSAWQQSVRARALASFADFVSNLQTGRNPGFWSNQLAVPVLDRWATLVPPERRHVITVPPAHAGHEVLWERFATVLGVDHDRYDVGTPIGNPSLGAPQAELLRRVNHALGDEFPLSKPYLGAVRRHLTLPVLMATPTPARFGAPLDARQWVESRSAQVVEELSAYPCHVVGDLEDLRPTQFSASRSPDHYTAEELLGVAVESIVGMVRHTDRTVGDLERLLAQRNRRIRALLQHQSKPAKVSRPSKILSAWHDRGPRGWSTARRRSGA